MNTEARVSQAAWPPIEQGTVEKGALPPSASSSSGAIALAQDLEQLGRDLEKAVEAGAQRGHALVLEQLGHDFEEAAAEELDPLQGLCEAWASWVRTRRFYKPPSLPPSILGRLTSRTRSLAGGPEAFNDAELHALNLAIEAQPMDALDRKVFELHYRHRVKGIKLFATALGIGRQHWYTLLRSFEQRVHAASLEILARNERERQALRSYSN